MESNFMKIDVQML